MHIRPPGPMKPWMRRAIREVRGLHTEDAVLEALSNLSHRERAFVDTVFVAGERVTVRQSGRAIDFPRPLNPENHRTILRGYVESLSGKYQLDGWCAVQPGDVVIDCGAYVGGFALAVAEIATRVVVLEPAPANHACCLRNLAGFEQIEVRQAALFDRTCTLPLQISSRDVEHSLLSPDRGATGSMLEVPVFRLDDLGAAIGLGHIDFLKLEAEGAEIEVVAGLGALRPTKIAIDAGPERDGRSPMPELVGMLGQMGYMTKAHGHVLLAVHDAPPEGMA